jgi:hypothetical protein
MYDINPLKTIKDEISAKTKEDKSFEPLLKIVELLLEIAEDLNRREEDIADSITKEELRNMRKKNWYEG